jgi:IS4 transposase
MQNGKRIAETEFSGADFGDERLNRRLATVAAALEQKPDGSFPKAMVASAELEAFYRFLSNDRVSAETILAPHRRATVERCAQAQTIICVEDTTMFQFQAPREGLGAFGGRTFFAHVGLALDTNGIPLGVLGLSPWARTKESTRSRRRRGELSDIEAAQAPNENDRWIEVVEQVEREIGDTAEVIHVMDSEGDDYDVLQQLITTRRRFVIRGGDDRRLESIDGSPTKMAEAVASCPVRCTRAVRLSRRGKKRLTGRASRRRDTPRDERKAKLSIGATRVRVCAPRYLRGVPESLDLNVVCVREANAPEDVDPVEWFLLTTEPVDTKEEILRVVDLYRHRWKIEELFKALKTGCAFPKRQLNSYKTLVRALALFLPIAWNLLRLRTFSRLDTNLRAETVLSEPELIVLRAFAEKPLPKRLTIVQAMLAIARLGGHIKNNGPPGWITLGSGYLTLIERVHGYLVALRAPRSDQS